MSEKSTIKCITPTCVAHIERYGERQARVYDKEDGAHCENCGAVYKDGVWTKTCVICKKQTDELYGLFVPHRCKDCQEAERIKQTKANNRCLMCRQLYMDCCC